MEQHSTDGPAENELPTPGEAEAVASLREYALGPVNAVFTWSEAGVVLDLVNLLATGSVVEIAARNPNVSDYLRQLEAEVAREAQS